MKAAAFILVTVTETDQDGCGALPASGANERLLDEVREEIARADNKAAILLAGMTAFAGILVASWLQGQWSAFSPARTAVLVAGALALLAAGAALTAAIYPRGVRAHATEPRAFVYFGDASDWNPETLAEHLAGLSPEDILRRDSAQILTSSHIVCQKYRLIRGAIWSMAVSAALMVLALILQPAT